MSTRLGQSFEGVRVNSFGQVVRARLFEGGSFEGIRVNSFGHDIRAKAHPYQKC